VVSESAQSDIGDIVSYTTLNWGAAQARAYLNRITAAIEALAERPQVAVSFDHRGRTYLRKRVGSHAVFARVDEHALVVMRILHVRMDTPRHLN
jgi:toxin ParE1/3/4